MCADGRSASGSGGAQYGTAEAGGGSIANAVRFKTYQELTRDGVWEQIQPFTDRIKLEEGDAVVLCSDGVETAGVSVEEMGRLLLKDGNLDRGAERVIERCRELGAPDNVTLAVARVEVDVTKTAVLPKLKI